MNDIEHFKRTAVHAKQLLLHGCSHADSEQPVHRMIAVHDMHNAVEWLLAALWMFYSEGLEKPPSMMKLFDSISKDKQRLIFRREIELLNQARNQAQHHAVAPSKEALLQYTHFCEAFFRQTLRDVSEDCEYDDLFVGLLLPDSVFDFYVVSHLYPPSLITWFGGKVEPTLSPEGYTTRRMDDWSPDWSKISLNLREMFIQAERRISWVGQDEWTDQHNSWRTAMEIMAFCIYYGQSLAVRGLRNVYPIEYTGEKPDPGANWADQVMDGYAFPVNSGPKSYPWLEEDFRPGKEGYVGILPRAGDSIDLFASLHDSDSYGWVLDWDTTMGFFKGYDTKDFQTFLNSMTFISAYDVVSPLVGLVELLLLGIDLRNQMRFIELFRRTNTQTAPPLGRTDVLWCRDYVFSVLMDLTPLISELSHQKREFHHVDDELFGF